MFYKKTPDKTPGMSHRRFLFQYFSDLHLERRPLIPRIPQTGDYLILAGDVGYPHTPSYEEFLQQCGARYKRVFVVYGNHEWDRGSPFTMQPRVPHNVHLLENQSYTLVPGRLTLFGTTLWTPTVRKTAYNQAVKFLHTHLQQIASPRHHTICITHHLPSYHLIAPQFQRYHANHRFANHLDALMYGRHAPRFWICGHSHALMQRRIGHTTCLLNALPRQHTTSFTIPLEDLRCDESVDTE